MSEHSEMFHVRAVLQDGRRFLTVLLLGFVSGLPLALTGGAMQAWLTVEGLDLVTLGFLVLVAAPYTFKILWAPLIDRFDVPWLGRRRGWIVLIQWMLGGALFLMAGLSPVHELPLFAAVAVSVAALSATLDVVIDGYRTDLLEPHERGLGGSLAVLGYRLAMVLSGGIALIWAEQWHSWPQVYRVMGGLMFGSGLLALLLMPRLSGRFVAPATDGVRELLGFLALLIGVVVGALLTRYLFMVFGLDPESKERWIRLLFVMGQIAGGMMLGLSCIRFVRFETLNRSLMTYFEMPGAWVFLALVVLYKIGDAFALSLSTPFLINGAHFSQTEVGIANKTVGLLMTIVGAVIGGFFLLRVRLSRALFWFGAMQLVSNLGFYALARVGPGFWGSSVIPSFNVLIVHLDMPTDMDRLLLFVLSLDNFAGGMGTAAFVALLSNLCNARFSATHYALLSAFAALGRVFVGPFAGVLADACGWQTFFLVSLLEGVPGLAITWRMRTEIDAMIYRSSG
ncbi:MFS transporter [Xylella taiwanensis]|uniref:Beta-lactamase n=1 Tax=Xylella taiwanensis TaxID=1444770 RepID=Z9JH31_9GAMM|nr:MFS transporter [Xylella taiwanensis]AXI82601.1 beta-lactamase [Xylella taiwanensis]EWS77333.1 beta-lactamase [Xylella taiwanensis]MCD8455598.1 MFS transporter [Xylella taiwanensis]MCD8458005.1 MFS transporter [Xylella taiwanensis]MCD8460141.1 MFS transporter [Xylella taiwanensis]